MSTKRVFFISEDGIPLMHADELKLNKLPWYKRLWAKVSLKYRNKHTDIKGFKIGYNNQSYGDKMLRNE